MGESGRDGHASVSPTAESEKCFIPGLVIFLIGFILGSG
jgi:hypothetical protein